MTFLTASQNDFSGSKYEPTGFVDCENVDVTYDSTNKTITLAHPSGSVYYYFNGQKYRLASGWTSTAHGAGFGLYWLTIGANGAETWTYGSTPLMNSAVFVAYVWYTSSDKFAIRECHGLMDWETWRALHDNVGTFRNSGGAVVANSYFLNTNSVDAVTPAIEQARVIDEDLPSTINALSNGSTYTRLHFNNGTAVFTTGSTFPYPDDGSDIQYNQNPTSGTALTSMGVSNRWVNVYVLFVPVTADAGSQAYRHICMTGQRIYTTSAAALSEDFRTLSTGNLSTVFTEFVPYIRLTYKRTNSNLTRNAQFDVDPSYLVGSRAGLVSVSGFVPTDHGTLTGRTTADSHPATAISTSGTTFGQNLAGSAGTVQSVFEEVDNIRLNGQETNYIVARKDNVGWSVVGDFAVAISTTASELPRENTTGSGIKITATSTHGTGDYVYYDFTLDDVDLNRQLKIKFDVKKLATYAGELYAFVATQAARTTYISPLTAVQAADGTFYVEFTSGSTATLSLVIQCFSDMAIGDGICISDVVVGPGLLVSGAAVSGWQSYTPTIANLTTQNVVGKFMRIGDSLHCRVQADPNGTATGTITVTIPSGYTINTTALTGTGTTTGNLGTVMASPVNGATAAVCVGFVQYSSATTVQVFGNDTSAYPGAGGAWAATVPATWAASGDSFAMDFVIPVNELSVNAYYGSEQVLFASDDGSTDVFGPNGALVPNQAVGTEVSRAFLLPASSSQSDFTVLEYKLGSGQWQLAADLYPYVGQGSKTYGCRGYWSSETQYTVLFGSGGAVSDNASYAGNGSVAWSGRYSAGDRFRLRKISSPGLAGFNVATPTQPTGLYQAGAAPSSITGTAIASNMVGEAIGTQRAGTNGNTYSTRSSTIPTNSNATLISATLNKGSYVVSAVLSAAQPDVTVRNFVGTVLVGGTQVSQASIVSCAQNYVINISFPGVPVDITADGTVVAFNGYFESMVGTASQALHEMWVYRRA